MTERTVEVERKFSVPPAFAPALEQVAQVLGETTHELDATYHDTLALALADAGWSLRRRSGGTDAGWHLKRPSGQADARTEVQAPDSASIPADLRQEVREVTGLEALVPVARLKTTRVETRLGIDGRFVATVARDAVTASTAAGHVAWHEAEVELAPDADPALLDRVSLALERAGATRAAHESKVARAIGEVRRLEVPDHADAPARDVMLAWSSRQVGVLQALEAGVRVDAPDSVHKSRVATRRLRSLLKTFRPLFDRDRTDALRVELRWLGEMLGAPRDAEVLAEGFEKLLDDLGPTVAAPDVRHRLLDHLADQHAQAHAALLDALDGPRADALRAALVALLVDPPLRPGADRPADEVLPRLRERAIDEVASLRRWARREPGELERWHEVRKAAKAVRYAAEAMVGVSPELASDVDRWTAVTEAFGVVQDTVVASSLIDEAADATGARGDGVWGVLREAENERRRSAFKEGRKALREALDRR